MKTSLLFGVLLLIVVNTNAQIGIKRVYNPYLFASFKKNAGFRSNQIVFSNKRDTIFLKNSPLFSQYITKKKPSGENIFAYNTLGLPLTYTSKRFLYDIDLEKTKNRTKILFFKMKMWRYFRE